MLSVVTVVWYCTRPDALGPRKVNRKEVDQELAMGKLDRCEARLLLKWSASRLLENNDAADSKDRMLMAMSHELRTPVAGILGAVRILRSMPLTQDQRALLDGIAASAGLLSYQVTQVLRGLLRGKLASRGVREARWACARLAGRARGICCTLGRVAVLLC